MLNNLFSQAFFILGAALMAVGPVFFCPEALAESGASIFAPAVKDQAAEKKPAAGSKPSQASPSEGSPLPGSGSAHLVVDEQGAKTLVIKGEGDYPATSPSIVVDERGNRVLVINGGDDSEPSSITVDDLDGNTPVIRSEPGSSPIQVDEHGRKTLVIRGEAESDSSPIQVDERGHKTLVIKGEAEQTSSPSIQVDEHGRKTLVIKGDDEAPAALSVGDSPAAASPDGGGSSPWHSVPSTPVVDEEPVAERPYWIADQAEDVRPYFLETQAVDTTPYWLRKEEVSTIPYWQMPEVDDDGRYWIPEELKPKKAVSPVAATKAPPAGFAPAIHDASAGSNKREISVYMFKDEKGVVHVSNAPADPRFRLFNITVVDFKVQRGLSGKRMRFTHETLRPYIMKAAATYNLDPALIAAIIKSESAFDANAVSWAGAQGLMQLMPRTAREVGCHDPFDPEANIMGGSRYIRWMLDRFNGNLDLAIAAYNAGPTRVAREWKIPNIAETQNYVIIVKRNYARYQGEF